MPVNPDTWSRDPFGGELVEGEVWGRGAVDMLNITASMTVAFSRLARSGFRPRGTLILAAVADEEALGSHGAAWLSEHASSAVKADYVITEEGGVPIETAGGRRLAITVGEKGSCWCRIRVHGVAGHASAPLRTDNALVTAAEVIARLAAFRPPALVHDAWRRFVSAMSMPDDMAAMLVDAGAIDGLCDSLADVGFARQAHALTHMTIAPTVVSGGTKLNIIPDKVDIDIDVRTLPGQEEPEVRLCSLRLSATSLTRWRSSGPTTIPPASHPSARRFGTSSTPWCGVSTRGPRASRSSPQAPPTAGSSDARLGRLRLWDVLGQDQLRAVPLDVPRRRRAGRRRVPRLVDRDVRVAAALFLA